METPSNLHYDDRTLEEILESLTAGRRRTLVVVDGYHAARIPRSLDSVVVRDNHRRSVEEIRSRLPDQVIGVGTCAALDMAKAVASAESAVYSVPTVLTTACISNDKSVIRELGRTSAVRTAAPRMTIIPLREIMRTPYALRKRTSASGFGDILARLGAAADLAILEDRPIAEVLEHFPDTLRVTDWVRGSFADYDEPCIRALARFSHEASVVTMENARRGQADLNVGSEHALYYWLYDHFPIFRSTRYTGRIGKLRYSLDSVLGKCRIASHGEIVAAGTLISLRIEAERTGDFAIYELARGTFARLGLPTTRGELNALSLGFDELLAAMKGVRRRGAYLHPAADDGRALLRRVFP